MVKNFYLFVSIILVLFITISCVFSQVPSVEWIEIATGPKRFHHGLAYSTAQSAVIMFGGEIRNENPDRPLNETWSFTGGIWNQKNTPMAPPERAIFAMAYDKKREVIVIFGGSKSVGDRGDTWEFDGTNWTQKFPTNSPSPRWHPEMVYDEHNEVMVLYGGVDDAGPILRDTWVYDGYNWILKNPANNPGTRGEHMMAYDPITRKVVLHGGFNNARQLQSDTWIYDSDSNNWSRLNSARQILLRDAFIAWNGVLEGVIMFGGVDKISLFQDKTWLLKSDDWILLNPTNHPSARRWGEMVYDELNERIVLHGGSNTPFPEKGLIDTWILTANRNPIANTGSDVSHEGTSSATEVILDGSRSSDPDDDPPYLHLA